VIVWQSQFKGGRPRAADDAILDEVLVLTPPIRDAMVAHALCGLPNEACGLFAADKASTQVHTFFPMTNAAASSTIYQLEGAEMMAVESEADAADLQIIGVMHSHTHTTAYPSPTDVTDASAFDPFGGWHYIIVSLKDAEPVLRSYRIVDGEIAEEPVQIG
jgi:proteasome lid subunit RPN8/RPN11